MIEGFTARVLRRHVHGCTKDHSCRREAPTFDRTIDLANDSNAEIDDPRNLTIGCHLDDDVLGI